MHVPIKPLENKFTDRNDYVSNWYRWNGENNPRKLFLVNNKTQCKSNYHTSIQKIVSTV